MLKFANQLSDSFRYAVIFGGQSNARPNGTKAQGFSELPNLQLVVPGVDLTVTSGFTGTAGASATITVTSPTLVAGYWVGAEIRLGTPGSPLVGYGRVTANAAGSVTVTWNSDFAANTAATTAWLTLPAERWKSYETVRVLTPYLPEVPTDYPAWPGQAAAVPGYTFPATVTSYADAGLFLPFSFLEGVEGPGAATGVATAATATTVSVPQIATTNLFGGGYIRVHNSRARIKTHTNASPSVVTIDLTVGWIGGQPITYAASAVTCTSANPMVVTLVGHGLTKGAPVQLAGAPVPGGFVAATNYYVIPVTADTFTLAATSQDAQAGIALASSSTGTTVTLTTQLPYEIHVPHWKDNPAHFGPGYGFRYPSNDSQPCAGSQTGLVHNRPSGVTAYGYGTAGAEPDTFGMMLPTVWRLSALLGKPIDVIYLGINGGGLYPRNQNEPAGAGFQGQIGWWIDDKYFDWTPATDGAAARLKRMIEVIAPAAVTAGGDTRPLRILGVVWMQGEADATNEAGRELYGRTLTRFHQFLRGIIVDAGLSPYSNGAKVPAVHASLPTDTSAISDPEQLVNGAIAAFAANDGFAATFSTDDSPTLVDLIHFNGVGEAMNGKAAADLLASLINLALSVSGSNDERAVDICNVALSNLGDTAQVAAIDPPDGSAQAAHCARFYPLARDAVLAMRPWGFASKRVTLTAVVNTRTEWDFAYAVPADVMTATAVTASDADGDYVTGFEQTPGVAIGAVTNTANAYVPQDFVIEQDADGNKVLYTDQPDATLRYQARVTDTSLFPPLFVDALTWKLSAMLAGPIIKGDQGANEAKRCLQMMAFALGEASQIDANARQVKPRQVNKWIAGRRG